MTTQDMNRKSSARSKFSVPSSRSTGIIDKDLLYAQMSHHYRRLINAKSNVDSSQPRSLRLQERPRRSHRSVFADSSQDSLLEEPTPSEMDLVDRIVNDDKHRPDVIYRDHLAGTKNHYHGITTVLPRHDCTVLRGVANEPKQTPRSRVTSTHRTVNKPARVPPDLIDRHYADFEPADAYKPRILKSAAQSRVRDLKVYHPPRRKPKPDSTNVCHWNKQNELQQQVKDKDGDDKQTDKWLQQETQQTHGQNPRPLCAQCQCDMALEQRSSKVSIGSRDSAYNGGVSSGGESRGPTPEHNNLANLSANITSRCEDCNRSSGVESAETYNRTNIDVRRLKDRSPSQSPRRADLYEADDGTNRLSARSPPRQFEQTLSKVSLSNLPATELRVPFSYTSNKLPIISPHLREDVLYVTFTQAITADILSREILSDKGINLLFQRHMEDNKDILDMALMQKEIEMLRVELGIQENDDSNDYRLFNVDDPPSTASSDSDSVLPLFSVVTKSGLNSNSNNLSITGNSSSTFAHSSDASLNRHSVSLATVSEQANTSESKFGHSLPIQNQLLQAADFTDNSERLSVLYQNELEALPIERKSSPCSPNTIELKEYLNLVSCLSPNSPRKEDSVLALAKMLTKPDSTTITMDEIVGDSTEMRKHLQSINSNSLKMAIQEIIENILSGNVSDTSSIVDEPVIIKEDNMARANELPSPNEIPSPIENPKITTYVASYSEGEVIPEDRVFKPSWNDPHSNSSSGIDNKLTHANDNSQQGYSSSEMHTGGLCCFAMKKPSDKTNKKLEIENDNKKPAAVGSIRNGANKGTPASANVPKLNEEESWQQMEQSTSKVSGKPPHSGSSTSSKSSYSEVTSRQDQMPRVRKVSEPSSRKRSSYVSTSSSSISQTSACAVQNFRESVRETNEAHKDELLEKPEIGQFQARREAVE